MTAVLTIMEATVLEEDSEGLRSQWLEAAREMPEQVEQSWLAQGLDESDAWCVLTLWPGAEIQQESSEAAQHSAAANLFRSYNAQPAMALFDVVAQGDGANRLVRPDPDTRPSALPMLTVFEATVSRSDWPTLESRWREISQERPEQLVQSWLAQSRDDPHTWCAVGLWKSREAFAEYQALVDHLPATTMFRSLGVVPVLAAFQVMEEAYPALLVNSISRPHDSAS